MQVVLKKTVDALGHLGQVVTVSDAYARNYLLPKKLAAVATPDLLANQAAAAKRQQYLAAVQTAERPRAKPRLRGAHVRLIGQASPSGRLFAAIKTPAVLQALTKDFGVMLQAARLDPDHFKTTGDHPAVIHWPDRETTTILVTIANA